MQNFSFYIWIFPFFIPVAGFVLAKFPLFRKTRLTIDVLILFAAFMMDLQNVSLRSEFAGIVLGIIIMVIIQKIAWSALTMKVKLFRYTIVAAGLIIFIVKYGEWMTSSPEIVSSWFFPISTQENIRGDRLYEIQEFKFIEKNKTRRVLRFTRSKRSSLFFTRLDQFQLPHGYEKSNLKYRWYVHQTAGLTAVLIGGNDTLWSLKEVH